MTPRDPQEGASVGEAIDFVRKASGVYVVISPTAVTGPDFPRRGYAGPSGRLDVVARSLAVPLNFESGAVGVGVLLGPPKPPVTVMGYRECLGPGEKSAVEAIRRILAGRPPSGCIYARAGHDFVFHVLSKSGFQVVYLREGAPDISLHWDTVRCRCAYVAGAHVDVPAGIETDILRVARKVVSIGPRSLLTSQVFTFIAWLRASQGVAPPTGGSGKRLSNAPGGTG